MLYTLPLHGEQGAIEGMYGDQAVGRFYVYLGEQGAPTEACYQMGHLIYRGVAQGTQVGIDAIIDAVALWEGQIGDEPPFP